MCVLLNTRAHNPADNSGRGWTARLTNRGPPQDGSMCPLRAAKWIRAPLVAGLVKAELLAITIL